MMAMSEVATIVKGTLSGGDCNFDGVNTDSRKVVPGNLFVAIPGEKFDGHDFVTDACQAGAVGALVSKTVEAPLPQIEVQDTTRALGSLGADWRRRFDLPIAAITGSNGKTTVTAMVATILSRVGKCLAPEGSFNNQWGVPLTLLKLTGAHNFAVIEMGMNSPGEIRYLSHIARPDVALINNAAQAHLEGMGDVASIAREKSEIFAGLAADGIAVINHDDQYAEMWKQVARDGYPERRIVTFGTQLGSDVSFDDLRQDHSGSEFMLTGNLVAGQVSLPLAGYHNVMNALAAAAVSASLGVPSREICAGLGAMHAVSGRLVSKSGINGSTVLDDSYNANPTSMRAGIDVLAAVSGVRTLVLGAMAELGPGGPELHREVGAYARQKGIEKLICLATRDASRVSAYAQGFGPGAEVFDDVESLVATLTVTLGKDHTVLVKGSRSACMERVVERITLPGDRGIEGEAAAC